MFGGFHFLFLCFTEPFFICDWTKVAPHHPSHSITSGCFLAAFCAPSGIPHCSLQTQPRTNAGGGLSFWDAFLSRHHPSIHLIVYWLLKLKNAFSVKSFKISARHSHIDKLPFFSFCFLLSPSPLQCCHSWNPRSHTSTLLFTLQSWQLPEWWDCSTEEAVPSFLLPVSWHHNLWVNSLPPVSNYHFKTFPSP